MQQSPTAPSHLRVQAGGGGGNALTLLPAQIASHPTAQQRMWPRSRWRICFRKVKEFKTSPHSEASPHSEEGIRTVPEVL